MPSHKNNSDLQQYFTYRLTKLPQATNRKSLDDLFSDHARKAITAISIGSCPYYPEKFATATVTFRGQQEMKSLIKQDSQIVQVDDTFHGLTPLNTVLGPSRAVLVAITGLAGRAFESWQTKNGQMWLRDFSAPNHTDCRFFTFGYPSKVRQSQQQATISDFVENFVEEIKTISSKQEGPAPPVILIGHSLGCIIIKEAIVQSTSLFALPPRMYQSVCGIVFFGAPHRGLNNPELEELVEGSPPENLLRDLQPNSSLLSSLDRIFPNACKDIKIISCYETEHTYTYRLEDPCNPQSKWVKTGDPRFLVPPSSACLFWEDHHETRIAIHKDHSGIAKLDDLIGSPYYELERGINEIIDNAQDVMEKRRKLKSGPSSVLSLLFMLQYEYYWLKAWSSYKSKHFLHHGDMAEAFGTAEKSLRLLELPSGHPVRSIVDSITLIVDLLRDLVNRYCVKSTSQKQHDEKKALISFGAGGAERRVGGRAGGEAGGRAKEGGDDGRIHLRFTSIQFPLALENENDNYGIDETSGEHVVLLENWTEPHQEHLASLISRLHDENERLSQWSHHTASIDLLASSKVINNPRRTQQDLDKLADISDVESLYSSLSERAFTKKRHLDLDPPKDHRVPEYPLSQLSPEGGTGPSKFRILLPSRDASKAEPQSQHWVHIEWMENPKQTDLQTKRRAEKQHRLLAYDLSFSKMPPLLRMLPCIGIVEDLDQSRCGLLLRVPSWVDVARKPENLSGLLRSAAQDDTTILSPPALDDRLKLAFGLAYSVAELHCAGIVHKNLISENVLFFYRRFGQKISIADAFICGLGFSRPTGEQSVSISVKTDDLDMYQHPELRDASNNFQGRPPFKPKYDVYGLGVILLEIGLWMPLGSYCRKEISAADLRSKFISVASGSLPFHVGTEYCEAVLECLDPERQNRSLESISQNSHEKTDEDALFLDFLIKKVIRRLEK